MYSQRFFVERVFASRHSTDLPRHVTSAKFHPKSRWDLTILKSGWHNWTDSAVIYIIPWEPVTFIFRGYFTHILGV